MLKIKFLKSLQKKPSEKILTTCGRQGFPRDRIAKTLGKNN